MEVGDYHFPEPTTSSLEYSLERGKRIMRVMTTETISPLKAGAAIGIISATIVSLVNARKYKRGRMTKREAVLDTAAESAGMGLAAGLGFFASNAVRASVFVTSTSALIPITLGFLVMAGAKVMWDSTIKRHINRQGNGL